jgi:hypothetical protein
VLGAATIISPTTASSTAMGHIERS